MKKATLAAILLIFLLSIPVSAEILNPEKEQQLSDMIRDWGSEHPSVSLSDFFGYEPVKCATPELLAIRNYVQDAALSIQQLYKENIQARPNSEAPIAWQTPGGHFLLHYATEGLHAVYQAGVDNNSNGVPDYVEAVATIVDSVWAFEIDSLGFQHPPADNFYPEGLDEKYDVYLADLKSINPQYGNIYGYTQQEMPITGTQTVTSYIALDNDYAEIDAYAQRPLDAVRVTSAHEFFHAVQFGGYDAGELEKIGADQYAVRTHWIEMSAVWMEEQAYDNINDYYGYLPGLFGLDIPDHTKCGSHTYISLRTAHLRLAPGSYYQYGAVVWPLYLSQTLGVGIVKKIWEKCAEIPGPNVFQNGFNDAITEVSSGTENFSSALSEFYVWNYFTGSRAVDDYGYEEARNYPTIPDTWPDDKTYIQTFMTYPIEYFSNSSDYGFWPDYLGANYLRFNPVRLDSTLKFTLHGMREKVIRHDTVLIDWNVRMAKVNFDVGEMRVEVDPHIYGNHEQIVARDVQLLSDIIMILVPYAETQHLAIYDELSYDFTVIDTTIPIIGTTFYDPAPNPLKLSETASTIFKIEQPGREDIHIDVFTLAGEKVYENSTSGRDFIDWNGKNDAGKTVASGLYLVSIRIGDESKVFKVAVIE